MRYQPSDSLKRELETILSSFLERGKDGRPPTIAKYDIPRIVEVIGQRITFDMVRDEAAPKVCRFPACDLANCHCGPLSFTNGER